MRLLLAVADDGTGQAFRALGTTRARGRVDPRDEPEFNVPAASARLAEEIRLVHVDNRNELIGTARRAALEQPPVRPRTHCLT